VSLSQHGGLPAPRVDQRPAGTSQPGSGPAPAGQIFIGKYVIIFGPVGGLFLYDGPPGPGNPPIFAITQAAADPYGNPVTPGAATDAGMPFLIYSGPPSSSDLITTISAAGGTDAFGNSYSPGIVVGPSIGVAGTPVINIFNSGGTPFIELSTNRPEEVLPGFISTQVQNIGDVNEYLTAIFSGASVSGFPDTAWVNLQTSPKNGSGDAGGNLFYTDRSGVEHPLLTWGASGVTVKDIDDGNTYDVGHLDQFNTAAVPVTTTAFTPIPGFGIPVVAGKAYAFNGMIRVKQGTTDNIPGNVGFSGPAVSSAVWYISNNGGPWGVEGSPLSTVNILGGIAASAETYAQIMGTLVFSANGTLEVGGIAASGHSFTIQPGCMLNIRPIPS
jgi:hypothetical protein